MFSLLAGSTVTALALLSLVSAKTCESPMEFTACPLIRSYYTAPTISKSSDAALQLANGIKNNLDKLVADSGNDIYGPITPNTTSFAIVLFSGSTADADDSVLFEYHHGASIHNKTVAADTKFPVGDLTMVFTVYTWLVSMGEQWDAPITKFLPELKSSSEHFAIPWDDITIGALAGQLSGIPRESNACTIGKPCDKSTFVSKLSRQSPIFLPDTTPIVSYAAFQLLAFAMEKAPRKGCKSQSFAGCLSDSVLKPLGMNHSGVLGEVKGIFEAEGLNMSQTGEPAALSFVSSTRDLARAGHAMLTSKLISPSVTRRWLQTNADTSNLRNGVGRPWEIYHSGSCPTTPIRDLFIRFGSIGSYASYFGLTPDFNAGFAILAHDATVPDRLLDLNVYADVVSESLGSLGKLAAVQMNLTYAGSYHGENGDAATFGLSQSGPGLVVQKLKVGGIDIKGQVGKELGIKASNLDFRLYPTNVEDSHMHQFTAVFQDTSALIDAGTPTCITWKDVGASSNGEYNFIFELGRDGLATGVSLGAAHLSRTP